MVSFVLEFLLILTCHSYFLLLLLADRRRLHSFLFFLVNDILVLLLQIIGGCKIDHVFQIDFEVGYGGNAHVIILVCRSFNFCDQLRSTRRGNVFPLSVECNLFFAS
ncbi:hypothetical protein O6H91_01G169100 [Diphasiastrum complanatum]|uniref:Uncharacterized protein n=2 Tax=Diphasiastrum complanatum TaxID=34168 RepID=A0ACC2EZ46_DIPCM|nr:hypothetical protein O6H91_01G167900 [Diphasiastrum complanatum]KAJ7571612.1 hypothetical protein O6H91_01G169100 [Diphasiastrum complanatum]